MDDLLKNLFAVYDSLLEPPWTEHEAKMKKLWAALDALKAAASEESSWAVVRIQWLDSDGWRIGDERLQVPNNGALVSFGLPPKGAHSMRIGIRQRKKERGVG